MRDEGLQPSAPLHRQKRSETSAMLRVMLYRDCSARPADTETDLAVDVVRAGNEALTLRAIARQRGVDPATLVRRWGSKEDLMDAVLLTMESRWILWITRQWRVASCAKDEVGLAGLVGLLPDLAEPPDDPYDTRAHLTVTELAIVAVFLDLARNRPRSEEVVLEVRRSEQDLVVKSLSMLLGRAPTPSETDLVVALVDGLRRRLTDRHEPMALAAAHDALRTAVSSLPRGLNPPARSPGPA